MRGHEKGQAGGQEMRLRLQGAVSARRLEHFKAWGGRGGRHPNADASVMNVVRRVRGWLPRPDRRSRKEVHVCGGVGGEAPSSAVGRERMLLYGIPHWHSSLAPTHNTCRGTRVGWVGVAVSNAQRQLQPPAPRAPTSSYKLLHVLLQARPIVVQYIVQALSTGPRIGEGSGNQLLGGGVGGGCRSGRARGGLCCGGQLAEGVGVVVAMAV